MVVRRRLTERGTSGLLQTRQGSLSRKKPSNSTKPERVLGGGTLVIYGLPRVKVRKGGGVVKIMNWLIEVKCIGECSLVDVGVGVVGQYVVLCPEDLNGFLGIFLQLEGQKGKFNE